MAVVFHWWRLHARALAQHYAFKFAAVNLGVHMDVALTQFDRLVGPSTGLSWLSAYILGCLISTCRLERVRRVASCS